MYRIFLHFVICSGNFIFFPVALYFLQHERKRVQADFYGAIYTPPIFFLCMYIQSSRSDFFIKYKQTIFFFFFSKGSRVIYVCSTGPRRFWFVLESAAVSYSDFI